MDAARLRIENVLHGLGLFRPARALYGLTAGRRAKKSRTLKRTFFSTLLAPGDLVFDIGANLGSYAEIFASLGARVVAFEPNCDCVSHIRRSYGSESIDVVNTAVGASAGVATIRLALRSDMSSMSPDWIQAMQRAQHLKDTVWANQLTVPVITLDSLIEQYGMPKYIKIDVEGSEESVLKGLSNQPPLLSFEFNTTFRESTSRCLDMLENSGDSLFNFVIGEPARFELDEWVPLPDLRAKIGGLAEGVGYGDIFVMRAATTPQLGMHT